MTKNYPLVLSLKPTVWFGLLISVVRGFIGLWHFNATVSTTGREMPVLWYVAAWLAYFTTPAFALTLLFRYRIVTPTIPVAYLAYDLLTGPFTGKGVDGHYPGLIVVVWPAMLVLIGVIAGVEIAVKSIFLNGGSNNLILRKTISLLRRPFR
ncbi:MULTISPECIES: hypothetical protein [Halorussus]|uniref:hypothetical protein n=1 Tax=Halorussus TaxID=1070314 RepID=UPI00209F587A|nr:hypothetical protein [Halorussus vallis]USZ74118.1 hypothetical protein NGM07_11715 [Halorussus vallis]